MPRFLLAQDAAIGMATGTTRHIRTQLSGEWDEERVVVQLPVASVRTDQLVGPTYLQDLQQLLQHRRGGPGQGLLEELPGGRGRNHPDAAG